jgi:hypothetical protein
VCSLKLVKKYLDQLQGKDFTDWKNSNEDVGLFLQTVTAQWD